MRKIEIADEEDSSGPPKFNLRMPKEMRERIELAKQKSGRSMNGELVARIQASLDTEQIELVETIRALCVAVEQLKESVDAVNKRLDKL